MIYQMLCQIWQWAAIKNDHLFRGNADFSEWRSQKNAGFTETQGNQYQPSNDQLKKVLRKYSINENDAILDIGCGKGKAMYLMSFFPFGKIHGYDLSKELVQIANRNFEKLGLPQCQAFHANAMEFDDYDEYNYFYIFNSFPQSIFEIMMGHILESIQRNPRNVRFIYLNPVCHKYIEAHTPFHLVYKKRALIPWFTYHCYELQEESM